MKENFRSNIATMIKLAVGDKLQFRNTAAQRIVLTTLYNVYCPLN